MRSADAYVDSRHARLQRLEGGPRTELDTACKPMQTNPEDVYGKRQ
jgi:hypothetical protein